MTQIPPPSLDDTQPGKAVRGEPVVWSGDRMPQQDNEAPPAGGIGCGVLFLISLALMIIAVAIVGLAGAAGWTQGQREANTNLTATARADLDAQLALIPRDVENGNTVLLDARIHYLETRAPNLAVLPELQATGTALALTRQPTATPSPTVTSTFVPAAESTSELAITPAESGGYDLAALLAQAQAAVASGAWSDAVELLDVIMAIDETYQTQTVRQLMRQALNSYALQLYNANQPAAANIIVGRAEELGLLDGNLSYERYVAELFLNARAAVAVGDPRAIGYLNEILNQGAAGRYYNDARQLLYELYVRRGDAWVAQGEYCPAVPEYQNAVRIFASGIANGKLTNAQNLCALATPTPDPLNPTAGTPPPGFAPVGQPGQ